MPSTHGTPAGDPYLIGLRETAISLDEAAAHVAGDGIGGVATFSGSVRADVLDDGTVDALEYEAYAGVAEKVMREIAHEAVLKCGATRVAVLHRTGRLTPGETAVVCAAGAAHRAEAFSVCRYLIDELKARVPIWKKEWAGGKGEWVVCNHPGPDLETDPAS